MCPAEIAMIIILLFSKTRKIVFFIASRFLDSVPVTAISYFRESAEKLIEERGAVDALAAALAHISGATSLEQRSLLNSDAVSFAFLSRTPCIRKYTRKSIDTAN